MFPSTNTNNPFELLSNKPHSLCDHQTPKHDLDPSFFFPSHLFDENEFPLNHIIFSQNQITAENHQNVVENHIQKNSSGISTRKGKSAMAGIVDSQAVSPPKMKRRNLGAVPRKRTGKKDRHSKICTAQGIRDRRMRLSLHVARKFFDLQDMLGYDKASKTIDWLFTKSKKAIKEFIEDHRDPTIQVNDNNDNICTSEAKSECFLSECEVVSGIEEASNNIEVKEGILPTNIMPVCHITITPCETRDHDIKPSNTLAFRANTMKESRDKARARARCRTREKMMIKGGQLGFTTQQLCKSQNPNHDNDVHKLGSSSDSPFDQESGCVNQEKVFAHGADFTSHEQQLADVGTIEKLLKGSTSSSSSRSWPISQYNNNNNNQCYVSVSSCIDSNFMGLIGSLDLVNSYSQYSVTNQVSLAGLSSLRPIEGVDQESDSCKEERVSQFVADEGTIEKLLEINSSSSSISNGGNNNFMGFLGNWDMLNNIDRLNFSSVTNHVSLAGNPASIYSAPVTLIDFSRIHQY